MEGRNGVGERTEAGLAKTNVGGEPYRSIEGHIQVCAGSVRAWSPFDSKAIILFV